MSEFNLKPTETKILLDAGSRDGTIVFPDHVKRSARERIAGLFAKYDLVLGGPDPDTLRLTSSGYCAVGLQPPNLVPTTSVTDSETRTPKREIVLQLLGRGEGASLPELVAATGWLPHTTRAALSRLRSGGQDLAKSKRPDGVTCYRIMRPEPVVATSRRGRRVRAEADARVAG